MSSGTVVGRALLRTTRLGKRLWRSKTSPVRVDQAAVLALLWVAQYENPEAGLISLAFLLEALAGRKTTMPSIDLRLVYAFYSLGDDFMDIIQTQPTLVQRGLRHVSSLQLMPLRAALVSSRSDSDEMRCLVTQRRWLQVYQFLPHHTQLDLAAMSQEGAQLADTVLETLIFPSLSSLRVCGVDVWNIPMGMGHVQALPHISSENLMAFLTRHIAHLTGLTLHAASGVNRNTSLHELGDLAALIGFLGRIGRGLKKPELWIRLDMYRDYKF